MIDAAMLGPTHAESCRDRFREYDKAFSRLKAGVSERLREAGDEERYRLAQALMPMDNPFHLVYNDDGSVTDLGPTGGWAPADDPRWQRLRELKAAVHNQWREESRRRNELLRGLFTSLQEVLDDAGSSGFSAQQFLLTEMAHHKDERAPSVDFAHINIAHLAADSLIDGSLRAVCDHLDTMSDDPYAAAMFQHSLRDILRQYYASLEPLMVDKVFQLPSPMTPDQVFFSERVPPDQLNRRLSRNGEVWRSRYTIDHQTVQHIETLVRSVAGDDLASRWQVEYRRAACPELFSPRAGHEVLQWCSRQNDMTREQLEAVRILQKEHDEAYAATLDRAFNLGVAACRQTGLVMLYGPDSPWHDRYWSAVVDLHVISASIIKGTRVVLTASQAGRFQSWLDKSVVALGPSVMRRQYLSSRDRERLNQVKLDSSR